MSENKNTCLAVEIVCDLLMELKAREDALTELQKMADNLSSRIKTERENMERCLDRLGERR